MKLILDECLPKRLLGELGGHQAMTVPMAGWAGLQNGELLDCIAGKVDAFITIDANLVFQQQLARFPFSVLVLRAPSNRFEDLLPLVPRILEVLKTVQPGEVAEISV